VCASADSQTNQCSDPGSRRPSPHRKGSSPIKSNRSENPLPFSLPAVLKARLSPDPLTGEDGAYSVKETNVQAKKAGLPLESRVQTPSSRSFDRLKYGSEGRTQPILIHRMGHAWLEPRPDFLDGLGQATLMLDLFRLG
jgi:hypothetical protein